MALLKAKHRCLPGLLILVLAVGLAGCSDTASGDNDAEGDADQYVLLADGSQDVRGEIQSTVEMSVLLLDQTTGAAVDDEAVEFEVLDDESDEAPSLTARNVTTDEEGAAEVGASLGAEEGSWTIRADHESADPVDFMVTVGPVPTGEVEVELVHSASSLMELSDIDVRIYRSIDLDCSFFQPLGSQAEEELGEQHASAPDQSVTFEELPAGESYVVTAQARGEHDQIAAAACRESVTVHQDQTTNIEAILQLIPINPIGTYDVLSHWDFTEALAESGPAGSTIVDVLNFFDDPGAAIYDEIIELLGDYVSSLISGALDTFLSATGLDDEFQAMINDFIEDSDGLSEIQQTGQELGEVVSNLEVVSEMSIGKLAQDHEFSGQDNWLGINLYWSQMCEDGDPDEDPDDDCDLIELNADADGEFGELGIVSANWNGRVVNHHQLEIYEHTVALQYGQLISYILNDVMLPAITDGEANSLSEAFAYWFGCDSLADSITGSDDEICAMDYCLDADTIEGFCDTAVTTVFSLADILISSLEYDMGLRLGGEGILVEETSDGAVDRIVDGVYEGYIEDQSGDSDPVSFDATWEAERTSSED